MIDFEDKDRDVINAAFDYLKSTKGERIIKKTGEIRYSEAKNIIKGLIGCIARITKDRTPHTS
jgi:hypothetical protein